MNYEKGKFYVKYKGYIMIDLTFLKKLTSIRQMYQKSEIFVTISIF